MRLSYSAISTYQKCPLSYKYLYRLKLPTKPSHHLSFGSSIHSALEFFYNVDVPKPCSLERLLEELDNAWLRDGYESEKQEQEFKEKGRAILTQFYHENLPLFAVPLAIEQRFSLDLDGITINGIIDRVDRLQDGGIEIIDYKTNNKLPPKTKINTDLQLPIYHMAVENIYGEPPQKVTLYFLVPNQKMSARKTKSDIKRAKEIIHKVAANIQAEKFEPFKNPLCPWCDFIERCLEEYPDVHKGDPHILSKATANGKISGKETQVKTMEPTIKELKQSASKIEEAVDEYLGLVEQINSARVRIGELQEIIHEYCEANELAIISGTKGELARKAHRTTHYNVNKLKKLLEPRGLWDKVLDVNGRLLKELLEDERSQGELRKLIETAKEMEEISYALYIKDELAEEQEE